MREIKREEDCSRIKHIITDLERVRVECVDCVCAQISSMQAQIISQEATQQIQEKELNRTKTDLYCLEQEEQHLEENLRAGKAKLESILKLLKTSQNEMDEVRGHTHMHTLSRAVPHNR